jgi:threonine/homoserine/homoserine lactone efflux protein
MDVVLGVMLGLAYVAAPGPINIETVRRGLAGGWKHGFAVQVGAVCGDLAYAILAWAGLGLALMNMGVHRLVQLGSAAVLVYLGWSALCGCWRAADLVAEPVRGASAFWAGVTLSLNPYAITFWLAMGSTIMSPQRLAVVGGFFLACLLWALAIALLVGQWRARITTRFARWASCGCGVVLIASGLSLGYFQMLI